MGACAPCRATLTASPAFHTLLGMRTLVVGLGLMVVVAGCNGSSQPAKDPPKSGDAADAHSVAVPSHAAAMRSGEQQQRRTETATGSIEAMIGGEHHEFRFLPYGKNAAIYAEDTGVARIVLAGSEGRDGYPALHLVLENVRLDRIEKLPATFGYTDQDGDRDVMAKIRYLEDDRITWASAAEATRAGKNQVTIESIEGSTIRGTFEGVVVPPAKRFGEPKPIERGRFEVTVRLSGIEPAPVAEAIP